MAKFMLIIHGPPDVWKDLTPEELQQKSAQYQAWADGIRASGRYVSGEKLAHEGGRLLSSRSGKVTIVDGPYAESKEVVGGYMVIRAENYEDALELVRTSPMLERYRIELRETDPMGCGGD
jgi:hypothetical protein